MEKETLSEIIEKCKSKNKIMARWYTRIFNATIEEREELEAITDKIISGESQLKKIKAFRKPEVKVGDVFLVQPRWGLYFYGQVLEANMDYCGVDAQIVVFFQAKTKELNMDRFNQKDILVEPTRISKEYWKCGFFYTVGNAPLTLKDGIDYGFYSCVDYLGENMFSEKFVDSRNNELAFQPKLFCHDGISTSIAVASKIGQVLICNKELDDRSEEEKEKDKIFTPLIKKPEEIENEEVKPFKLSKIRKKFNVTLDAGEYCQGSFDKYGLTGNGYEWEQIMKMYVKANCPEMKKSIKYDSEAEMFAAYSSDFEKLEALIKEFKLFCDNKQQFEKLCEKVDIND